MSRNHQRPKRQFSTKRTDPYGGAIMPKKRQDMKLGTDRTSNGHLIEESNLETWRKKAAKHPVLTASAIAGLASLLWKNATKSKP
ncbi:hypothetical protein SAMN04487975_101537 [Planococcus glaciei]|nr:hypothetical protein SAMN04487975_101537 [Planococcus glaciei]